MAIRVHKFLDASHFGVLYTNGVEQSAHWRKVLDDRGKIDRRSATQYVFLDCRRCGEIGLLLGYDDAIVRQHFACATEYGRRLLTEPARVPEVREIEMHVGPDGGIEKVVTGENLYAGMTEYPLSLANYHPGLWLALAFGDASTCAEFAAFAEARYRSPGIVASEQHFQQIRGYKAWIRGETAQAIRDFEAVRDAKANPYVHADMSAWLALARGDADTFRTELTKVLEAHKALYRRKSGDPDGIICYPALALSRVAKTQGVTVEDDGYLPARLVASTPVRIHG